MLRRLLSFAFGLFKLNENVSNVIPMSSLDRYTRSIYNSIDTGKSIYLSVYTIYIWRSCVMIISYIYTTLFSSEVYVPRVLTFRTLIFCYGTMRFFLFARSLPESIYI